MDNARFGYASWAVDADMARLYDDKSARELLTVLQHELSNRLNQGLAGVAREADQNDPGRIGMGDKDQPTKVFVFRQNDASLAVGLFDQLAVVGTLRYFADGEDIVARGS